MDGDQGSGDKLCSNKSLFTNGIWRDKKKK